MWSPVFVINLFITPLHSTDNDICILKDDSCCNKAVENKLLEKTKSILKNRVFLVLNEFYSKIDVDKNYKNSKFYPKPSPH